jgi:hypothetical protein
VATCVAVTLTPGNTPPLSSTTRPEIPPPKVWAATVLETIRRKRLTAGIRRVKQDITNLLELPASLYLSRHFYTVQRRRLVDGRKMGNTGAI